MTSAQHSLGKRLGGYDVIAAVIDDMFTAMRRRPRVCAVRRGTQPRLTHPLPAAPGRPEVPTQRRSVRVHRTRHEDVTRWTGDHRSGVDRQHGARRDRPGETRRRGPRTGGVPGPVRALPGRDRGGRLGDGVGNQPPPRRNAWSSSGHDPVGGATNRRVADNRDAGGVISYIGRMQRVGGGRG
jgi:hypothetical protein